MTDLSTTIAPKSDQLNYDDFIGKGSITIKVTGVKKSPDDKQQPVAISYEGDNGKPYKPCLSMRRVLVTIWGSNADNYVGRTMTLYGDPSVKFGGIAVGGIRISHMSDLEKSFTMALSVSKASRKPYTIHPIGHVQAAPVAVDPTSAIAKINACQTLDELKSVYSGLTKAEQAHPDVVKAKDARKGEVS